jgi:hypothetical protein
LLVIFIQEGCILNTQNTGTKGRKCTPSSTITGSPFGAIRVRHERLRHLARASSLQREQDTVRLPFAWCGYCPSPSTSTTRRLLRATGPPPTCALTCWRSCRTSAGTVARRSTLRLCAHLCMSVPAVNGAADSRNRHRSVLEESVASCGLTCTASRLPAMPSDLRDPATRRTGAP